MRRDRLVSQLGTDVIETSWPKVAEISYISYINCVKSKKQQALIQDVSIILVSMVELMSYSYDTSHINLNWVAAALS